MPISSRVSPIAVAPMMDWTDRHCRYFHRLLAPRARLYTEMVTTGAVLHGDRARLLRFHRAEHPVALQLGGCDPVALAECASIGEAYGYDEINLNVGCPSDRVQSGRFGACLMREPETVARGVRAMSDAVSVPVTVKTRLGVDDLDSDAHLHRFVGEVASAGCDTFIVHARKAWLSGLSPKQNREVPPLEYDRVYRLKEAFPDRTIVLNGGIPDTDAALRHLQRVDGVMLGRTAYQRPYELARLHATLAGAPAPTREWVVREMRDYLASHLAQGGRARHVVRHMLGLYHGQPRARRWRRVLGEGASRADAGVALLQEALAAVRADGVARPRGVALASR